VGDALDFVIWLLVAAVVATVASTAVIAVRRFLLERSGGTVECAMRVPAGGGAWRQGVAAYRGDELHWYRVLGLAPRPKRVFTRRSLRVISQRLASPAEARLLGPGRAVVEIAAASRGAAPGPVGRVELGMTPEALTGFLAWLEASPPSSHLQDIALFITDNGVCPAPGRSPALCGARRAPENRRTPNLDHIRYVSS
jgi:hypothetical protein